MSQPSAELAAKSVTMPSAQGSLSERRLEGAQQPGHMRVARSRQHPVEFDVRVDARGDAAEDLEDASCFEDHAGVALLGAQHPRCDVERQGGVGLLERNPHFGPTVADVSISDSRYWAAAGSYSAS